MKYDLTKKPTRGAQRTLDSFSTAMFDMLGKKTFESITVNEICERSNYPRATFYNYFDDKYDLVQYCWYLIGQKMNLDEHNQLEPDEALTIFFNRLYQLFSQNQELLIAIIQHNPLNSGLAQHFNTYFKQMMQGMFIECFDFKNHPVPLYILADHFSNTVLLMLEWCFFKKETISLSEAHNYLHILLGKLEKY